MKLRSVAIAAAPLLAVGVSASWTEATNSAQSERLRAPSAPVVSPSQPPRLSPQFPLSFVIFVNVKGPLDDDPPDSTSAMIAREAVVAVSATEVLLLRKVALKDSGKKCPPAEVARDCDEVILEQQLAPPPGGQIIVSLRLRHVQGGTVQDELSLGPDNCGNSPQPVMWKSCRRAFIKWTAVAWLANHVKEHQK